MNTVTVTPTIDTTIYASGDQLGSLMTFPGLLGPGKSGQLVYASVYDKALQSAALSLLLFSSQPTIASSDNAALNISDAEMLKCMAAIPFTTAYTSTSANSINTIPLSSGNNPVLPIAVYSTVADGTIYAIMRCGGTPTYGAASDLVITLGVMINPSIA